MMPTHRQILLFLLASMLLSLGCYRDAFFGQTLLAPLDIGPTLFPHYRFMDPSAGQVPDNHHIIDQFTYDLPLQKVIYDAYHAGEIPWWDPWTYGGRPLLADAHVNGTDPIRLFCYALLPFELAYNWNFILRGILTGLGMFLLLKGRTSLFPAFVLALTYQFAGWFTVFWAHPWIQGSFVYYPFLWLVWQRGVHDASSRYGLHAAVGGILTALVLLAGNLQSHVYLPIFATGFLAAIFLTSRPVVVRALSMVAFSGILGALLAAPVLANQVEFYLLGQRPTGVESYSLRMMAGVLEPVLSIYPWPGGDFKTLGFAREILKTDGFTLFAGGAVGLLAIAALAFRRPWRDTTTLTAIFLVLGYLLIVCTPLGTLLYSRIAPMAGMGIILIAARWWEVRPTSSSSSSSWQPLFRGSAVLLPVLLGLWTFILPKKFPDWIPMLSERVEASARAESGGVTLALRHNQIKEVPNRLTLKNPAALLGAAALTLALGAVGWAGVPVATRLRDGAALFGLASTLAFHADYIPRHDAKLWEKLREGGPPQKEIASRMLPGQRLDESKVSFYDSVFPNAFPAFYQIHAVHGYSALQPASLFRPPLNPHHIPSDWVADFSRKTGEPFQKVGDSGPSRFRNPDDGNGLPIEALDESHNRLLIRLQAPASAILRTDTRFPGWQAEAGQASPLPRGCVSIFSLDRFPVPVISATYTYRPTWLTPALLASVLGGVLCLGFAVSPFPGIAFGRR